jgi:integrative and conjugative element protein (TIGR02256 family)
MKLLLPLTIIKRVRRELRGRRREIGGVLVGEHVADDTFRIADISVQRNGGGAAHFVRDPGHAKAFLAEFFKRTGDSYLKFNYIGEWHSHPAFDPLPSSADRRTMYDIVDDPDVGINFAVLIIVRLHFWERLQLSATLFRSGVAPESISVEIEDANDRQDARSTAGESCVLRRVRRLFKL